MLRSPDIRRAVRGATQEPSPGTVEHTHDHYHVTHHHTGNTPDEYVHRIHGHDHGHSHVPMEADDWRGADGESAEHDPPAHGHGRRARGRRN